MWLDDRTDYKWYLFRHIVIVQFIHWFFNIVILNFFIYKRSQAINDVDVIVTIPSNVKAKDLKIDIHPFKLNIELQQDKEWTTHISKTFPFRVNTTDCIWSLIPGQHVMVSILFFWLLLFFLDRFYTYILNRCSHN